MAIELTDESRKRVHEALHRHMRKQFDLDLGLLQADMLVDLVVGLVGATIYNQAIADAQTWLQRRIPDLEGDLHAELPEP